jgi:protein-export membrane protein SecD
MVQIPRWQTIAVVVILLLGLVYALPNVLPRFDTESLPGWVPHKTVSLGLDLQGGSYLLMEVDIEAALEQELEDLEQRLRLDFRAAKVLFRNLGVSGGRLQVDLVNVEQLAEARTIVIEAAQGFDVEVSDEGRFEVRLAELTRDGRATSILNQAIEIIRLRLDETGTREPSIQRQGDDRILVQLPGVDDPQRIKDLLGTPAVMSFRFVDETANPFGTAPAGSAILQGEPDEQGQVIPYVVNKRIMVKGEHLTDSQATFQDGMAVVSFVFDTIGAKRFADATRDNVGRIFAIVLDNKVISAPRIREAILGGSGIISGNFTVQSANDLAILLRAGALPAPITYLEERTVGASLGADSIAAGQIASILGFALVIVFMGATYGRFGLYANAALIANLVLIFAVLSGLQATLTLPGIAGIVLTIGMAVDANVLIFERIREEVHLNARGPVTAIDAGYRRALTTIIDSNLTTLIAAILLFQFGTGPIKGFAVTLGIGLVTAMFTAIMLTRLLIVDWLRRRRPQTLQI